MNKKLICIVVIILVPVLAILSGWLCNYMEYLKNKKNVCEYIDTHYNIEYKLQYSKIGKNVWPAGRQEDEFVFHDLTNNIYFQIISGEDGFYNYYNEAYNGKFIVQSIRENFPEKQYLEYIIRCKGKYDGNSLYAGMNCQTVFFTRNLENDSYKIYELLQYLKDNFPGINANIIITTPENKTMYHDLFAYKKIQNIKHMDYLYEFSLTLNDGAPSSYKDFCDYLKNYNI